ncbi:MAG TPA: TetR family transcriptional regulator [Solirubrobacteraceae bacterium]|nr:TetR family transcriptional regulator [Solirubrobacteraceae bacterium]
MKTREYRMGARADSVAATRRRILDAALELWGERYLDETSLEDVAARAGVTKQTLLRHFGSRDALLDAVADAELASVGALRASTPAGDVPAAVRVLLEDYERWGEATMKMLFQEERSPALRRIADAGRALHHEWVERVFAPWLRARRGAARARLRAQLIVTTDVYAWHLLRRDLGLGVEAARRALEDMLRRLEAR